MRKPCGSIKTSPPIQPRGLLWLSRTKNVSRNRWNSFCWCACYLMKVLEASEQGESQRLTEPCASKFRVMALELSGKQRQKSESEVLGPQWYPKDNRGFPCHCPFPFSGSKPLASVLELWWEGVRVRLERDGRDLCAQGPVFSLKGQELNNLTSALKITRIEFFTVR